MSQHSVGKTSQSLKDDTTFTHPYPPHPPHILPLPPPTHHTPPHSTQRNSIDTVNDGEVRTSLNNADEGKGFGQCQLISASPAKSYLSSVSRTSTSFLLPRSRSEQETLTDEGPALTQAHEGKGFGQCQLICASTKDPNILKASTTRTEDCEDPNILQASTTRTEDPNILKASTTRKDACRKIARAQQRRGKRKAEAALKEADYSKSGMPRQLPAFVASAQPFADKPKHATQKKGQLLCATKAINCLLSVPLQKKDVLSYAEFRSLRWSNGSSQCVVDAKFFCSKTLAKAKWDFILEYLVARRRIEVRRVEGIAVNNKGNFAVLEQQSEPVLLLMYHPKKGRNAEYYHVAALKGSQIYDCDLPAPVPLSSYESIIQTDRAYILRSL